MSFPLFRLAALVTLSVVVTGCRTGGESSGDVLRKQNLELQSQVAQLQKDASELRAKLAELVGAGGTGKSPEIAEATPRVASIEIDFLSGPTADASTPPQSDRNRTVAVYIKPLDGRGRFIQATGKLTVEVSRLASLNQGGPGATDTPARLLGSRTLEPLQLRDAYRAGFTGTYYVVDIPVQASDVQPPGQLLLRAQFADAITGASFEASRLVGLR
ncbi:MAG: hypothetical protein JNM86_15930 [Phycisphaerae bacterium]|nr:hypothetical protein [Phycisphaerae bacterium]MBN8596273.1 hypothetical protein [Planctomycetota bacterium]